jgi:hypothetical protein
MIHKLEFEKRISYDSRKNGITLDIQLRLNKSFESFTAKVDTGSSNCIFQRIHGENLGLDIETGEPLRISTATGSFLTFGHHVTLITEGLEFDSMVFFFENEFVSRNVLGRFGFLDRVIIGLNDYERILYMNIHNYE